VTDALPVPESADAERARMRRSYAKVLVLWVIVLVALYLFQAYFS
jgi:hypothetical protein